MKDDQRKEIQDLIDIITQENLTEIEVERRDLRIRIRREPVPAEVSTSMSLASSTAERPTIPQVTIESPDTDNSQLLTVTSPIVGTFYRSSTPDADSYVEVNDLVMKGQVLGIVEAMKLMNEIESEADGRVVKILAESGTTVEDGQPLFLINLHSVS